MAEFAECAYCAYNKAFQPTSWPRIQRDIPAVVRVVNDAVPGSYVEVQFPTID